MARMNIIELSVRDFRAIHTADINLNGITVVAGVNGCGKSTLSKLLYFIFHDANAFEELAAEQTMNFIQRYLRTLEHLQFFLYSKNKSVLKGLPIKDYATLNPLDLEERDTLLEGIKDLCHRFLSQYSDLSDQEKEAPNITRIHKIFSSTLRTSDNTPMERLIEILIERIYIHMDKLSQVCVERPYNILRDSLFAQFNWEYPEVLSVKEYGDTIIGGSAYHIPHPHIKKVAYIDTPMVLDMNPIPATHLYWKELSKLLKQQPKKGFRSTINNWIKTSIIKGDTYFDDQTYSERFTYKRFDGAEFDLLDCATGIKSFSLLQMLLKNQFLDENTLLILDEPETHLHPQWIVEYARLIVLLHKRLGVKFFIASHSTDLVSAIRYISQKERKLTATSFYVAETDEQDTLHYNFKHLGHEIEPIFESFNKAYKTLDEYVG